MRDKYSVALILPYYGTFPNYFPLWLKSAGCNKNFDFFVFTDIDCSCYKIPENVHVVKMTLAEIRERANKYLDFECVLNTPYKLCDYKPLYGLIFQDYLRDYEFWGHVDPDIIWGDMDKFITREILDKYDKIYRHGHLTIYRNTDKINHFVLHKLPGCVVSYKNIYKTDNYIGIDENVAHFLNDNLFSNFADGGGGIYYKLDFADISQQCKRFICYKFIGSKLQHAETVPAFKWTNGKIFGLSLNGESGNNKEYLYLHLQKRAMKFTPGLENEDSFLIVPNEFIRDHELTQQEIQDFMKPDPEYDSAHKKNLKYYVKKFFSFDTRGRILKILLRLYTKFGVLKPQVNDNDI